MSQLVSSLKLGWSAEDLGDALSLTVDGTEAHSIPILPRPAGPGAVKGIERVRIRRFFPAADTPDHPAHQFAMIELDRPDLAWRFSPDAGPWLVLVVVPDTALQTHPSGATTLTAATAELPDLSTRHLWCHALVDGDAGICRLICPRRLSPDAAWIAVLVPALAAGRQAGLGEEVTAEATELAWSSEDSVTLPVYAWWRFQTVEERGPAEVIARIQAGPPLGNREVALPAQDGVPDGGTVAFPGCLVHKPSPVATPSHVREGLRAALARVDEEADPPVVGPRLRGLTLADGGVDGPPWQQMLNLEPAFRAAAGVGEHIVRQLQEVLVAEAATSFRPDRPVREAARHRLREHLFRRKTSGRAQASPAWASILTHAALPPTLQRPELAFDLPSGLFQTAVRSQLSGTALSKRASADISAAAVASISFVASELVASALPDRGTVNRISLDPALNRPPSSPLFRAASDTSPVDLTAVAAIPSPAPLANERAPELGFWGVEALEEAAALQTERFAASAHSFADPPAPLSRPLFLDLLRIDSEAAIPGLEGLDRDRIVVLQPQSSVVEAILLGANEEMARELTWRELPGPDVVFDRFWSADEPDLDVSDMTDGGLGQHLVQHGPRTWVLIRAALLEEQPDLGILAYPSVGTAPDWTPDPEGAWLVPVQEAWVSDGTLLVCFEVDAFQLVYGHFLVFAEPDAGARFSAGRGAEVGYVATTAHSGAEVAGQMVEPPWEVWVHASRYQSTGD